MSSLKPETLYKPLAPNINLWREQGFTDDEINDHISGRIQQARDFGFSDQELNTLRSSPENPAKALLRGIVEAASLGFYVPDRLKQTPQETDAGGGLETVGQLLGSIVPFSGAIGGTRIAARGGRSLLGLSEGFGQATRTGRVASEAAVQGVAGGAVGGFGVAGEGDLRGAAIGAGLGAGLGAAGKLVSDVLAARAAARAAATPKPPPSEVIVSEPEVLALPPGPQPRGAFPLPPKKRVFEAGEEGTVPRPAPGEPPPRARQPRQFEEPPGEIAGRRGVPDEERLIRRPVEEPPRLLPTASERAQRRAGLDPSAPSERPSAILTPKGTPAQVPLRRPVTPEELVTRDAEDAAKVSLDIGPGVKRAALPAKPAPGVKPLVPEPVRPDPGTPERVRIVVQAGGKKYTFTRNSRAEADALQDQIRQAVPESARADMTFELTPIRATPKAPAPIEEPAGLVPKVKRVQEVRLPEEVEAPSVAELLDRKGYRFRVDHANREAPYTLVGPGGQVQRFKRVTDVIAFGDTLQDDVRATVTAKAIRGEKLTPRETGELRKAPKRRKVADQPLNVESDPRLAQVPPDPPPLPPIAGAAGGVGLPRPMWVEAVLRTRKLGRVDPDTGAFTPNPDGTRLTLAVESVLRTSPELEGPLRASFERPGMVSWNPIDVIGQPTSSLNPLVRKVAQETQRVEMAWDFEQRRWGEYFTKHFAHLTDDEAAQAARLVEGRVTGASQRVRDAAEAWRVAAQDFAKRLGLPEWAEYLTRLTSFQGVYEQWRPQILAARRFADLPESLQLKIGSDGVFTRMRRAFEKQTEHAQLPRDVKEDIEKRLLTWDVGQRWEALPDFVKTRLPKEMFDRFLLPRTGGVPFINDIRKSFQAYMAPAVKKLHVDPLLDRWGPIVNAMPGRANIPLSEGHYLNRYLDLFTSKESVGGLDRAVDGLVKTVENGLGRALADPNLASRIAARGAAWTYRGALGIDSAILNATQGINTWAQGGTSGFLRGLGRYVAGQARSRPDVGLLRQIADIYPQGEFIGPGAKPAFSGRLAAIDDKITRIALSPMAVAEHINRGVAFLSGMEEAAAMGLNSTQAFRAGWARASRVVPNLELTRAQMNAIHRVGESQFGYSPAHRSPYLAGPLARLSTIFWSYPTRQAQFITNNVADGLHSVITQPSMDAATRLTRYVALLGLMTGGAVMGAKVGVNLERVFGWDGLVPNGFAGPIGLAFQAYNAATAGPTTSQREIGKAWDKGLTILVPQFRTGKKVIDAIESGQRGFRVDQLGRQTYRTTPYGEFMRALGVEFGASYRERIAVQSIIEDNAVRLDTRRAALRAAIEKNDFRAAEQYNERYPELPLTERDLRAEMKLRLTPRVERVGPLYLRQQALEELSEPHEAMGSRP